MIIVNANMRTIETKLRIVTTNSYINQRGELVMGCGAAQGAKEKYLTLLRSL